jgi:CHAT domain-containing protein/Tfp pilus assembly protein PilF
LDFDGARSALEQALSIQENAPGGDPAEPLLALARLEHDLGNYAKGKEDAARSLAMQEATLRPGHPMIARTLLTLGVALADSGDLSAAVEADRRALEIELQEKGEVGSCWNNLGIHLLLLGQYEEAYDLIEKARLFGLALNGLNHPTSGHGLTNRGEVLRLMKRYPEAARDLEEAIRIKEKANGKEDPKLISTLTGLATVRIATGEYAEAQALLERANRIARKTFGASHPQLANGLDQMAELALLQRDYGRAETLARQSLDIQRRLAPDHPETAKSLIILGRVAWAKGGSAETLKLSLEANAVLRNHLRHAAHGLSEREALGYEAILDSGLDQAFSVVIQDHAPPGFPDAIRAVWSKEVLSRALVLDEMASRHRKILDSEDPGLVRLLAELEETRSHLARLIQSGVNSNPTQALAAQVRAARSEEENAERRLAAASGQFRETRERNAADLSRVMKALPPGSALVAFVQFHPIAPSRAGAGSTSEDSRSEYAAFVLAPGLTRPMVTDLGAAKDIDALVTRWNEAAGAEPAEPQATDRAVAIGKKLRRAVWDPIAARLASAHRIFIVPDGTLNLLAFDTLPSEGDRYLLETSPPIHYLSAERDLVQASRPGERGEGLLALGGAAFEAAGDSSPGARPSLVSSLLRGPSSGCVTFRSLQFAPLPGTRAEVDEVGSLWKIGEPKGKVVKLTGRDATESAFKSLARGKRVLHLATHGFFVDDLCATTFQSARQSAYRGPSLTGGDIFGESPLLLSGLAMAGANERNRPTTAQADDGILTAAEVATLDLRGVEWAVLSACGTGVGPVQTGEGVLGLRRAFQIAGARTVIMSLWPVGDVPARQWFRRLYEGRFSGLSTAESVRGASLALLTARRKAGVSTHPFYWGGFIASGDWR